MSAAEVGLPSLPVAIEPSSSEQTSLVRLLVWPRRLHPVRRDGAPLIRAVIQEIAEFFVGVVPPHVGNSAPFDTPLRPQIKEAIHALAAPLAHSMFPATSPGRGLHQRHCQTAADHFFKGSKHPQVVANAPPALLIVPTRNGSFFD